MNNILLFSGWQTCNIGDIGHTFGTPAIYGRIAPRRFDPRFVCLQSNEHILALLEQRFPRVTVVSADYAELAHPSRLLSLLDSSDLVIQNSGMHYNTIYNIEPILARTCIKHQKPFGLYGQSFDGFGESKEIPQLLSQAAFISCRDTHSTAYLKACGVTPRTLQFGPDGCFGIDVRNDSAADAYLKETGLTPKKFMAITLRSNSPNLHAGSSSRLNPVQITEAHKEEKPPMGQQAD